MARAKVESTADAVEEKKTDNAEDTAPVKAERSEERRVGKECKGRRGKSSGRIRIHQ